MDLKQTVEKLRSYLPKSGISNTGISGWSVGMHIHHCLLAVTRVCQAMIQSEPPVPSRKFSLLRTIILLTGNMPRGKAKAPEISYPTENITVQELEALFKRADELVERAYELPKDSWFKHFRFGVLAKKEALRFLAVHNNHHLKIIADILSGETRN